MRKELGTSFTLVNFHHGNLALMLFQRLTFMINPRIKTRKLRSILGIILISILIISCRDELVNEMEDLDDNPPEISDLSCPSGIEVDCQTAIYEAWYWVNSPKSVFYEESDIPSIRFRKSDNGYFGSEGAPSGAFFELSSDCSTMEIFNRFGTLLRTVTIEGLNDNVLVINDPTVYVNRNLVFVKFWDENNREVPKNIELVSEVFCQNSKCESCAFGFCNCSDGDGFECGNAIEDHHVFNFDEYKHSEKSIDGNILIAYEGGFGQRNAFGIMKINSATLEQMWHQEFEFEVEGIWNSSSSSDIIHQDSEGNIFAAGRKQNHPKDSFTLVKLNQDGDIIFKNAESFDKNTDVTSIRSLDGGGFVVLTEQNFFKKGFLRRYDSEGNLLWVNDEIGVNLQGVSNLDYIFVSDNEIHVFADESQSFGPASIMHFIFNSKGRLQSTNELDFVSNLFDSKGETGSSDASIIDVKRIGDKYLFYLGNPNFDFMTPGRQDFDYLIAMTDKNFNLLTVNLIPGLTHAGNNPYSYTLTESDELIYVNENADDNILIMRFNKMGKLEYIHELRFDKYDEIFIGGVHQISPTSFIITGHGKRFGQDVITILFSEDYLPNNRIECN